MPLTHALRALAGTAERLDCFVSDFDRVFAASRVAPAEAVLLTRPVSQTRATEYSDAESVSVARFLPGSRSTGHWLTSADAQQQPRSA